MRSCCAARIRKTAQVAQGSSTAAETAGSSSVLCSGKVWPA